METLYRYLVYGGFSSVLLILAYVIGRRSERTESALRIEKKRADDEHKTAQIFAEPAGDKRDIIDRL